MRIKFLDWVILLVLVGLLGTSLGILWVNLPTEITPYTEIGSHNGNDFQNPKYAQSKQFYQNMRFPDKQITYQIESACPQSKRDQALEAMQILEGKTPLTFTPSSTNPRINIVCSELAPDPEKENYFIAGEGGPTQIINTTLFAVILKGKISLYREEKCDTSHIAVHELLHVLGFDHNNNKLSILYPTLDCDQTIDDSLIADIKSLYSTPSLADLKITGLTATKEGKYLNFKIKIINQGLKEVSNTDLKIYADGKIVKFSADDESYALNELEIGTTKTLEVSNLIIPRFSKNIRFVVDEKNLIPEISETNNVKELVLITE